MKKNNKGFTLIELLAIIVILAIIAVITVPIILNIIENSRKGAATDSAYGYKDAINKYYLGRLSENQNYNDLDGEYTIDSDGYLVESGSVKHQIQTSGQKPSGGTMTIENKIITTACIQMGDYKVSITNGNVGQAEKGNCSSSNIPYIYGYLDIELGTIDELDPNWNNYLRKNSSISTNPVEVCSKFSGGTVCIEEGRWDCEIDDIVENNQHIYTCSDSTSYVAQKKAEAESKGADCAFEYYVTYHSGSNNSFILSCGDQDKGVYISMEPDGYAQNYDNETNVLCETETDSCYMSS